MTTDSVKIASIIKKADKEAISEDFGSFGECCRYIDSVMKVSVEPVVEYLWGLVARTDDDEINASLTALIYALSVRL